MHRIFELHIKNQKSVRCNDVVNTKENKLYHPFNYVKRTADIINRNINLPHQTTIHEQRIVAYIRKRVEFHMEKLLFKATISQRFTEIPTSSYASLSENLKSSLSLSVTSIMWSVKEWMIKEYIVYDK